MTYVATTKTLAWDFNNLDFGSASTLICGTDGTQMQFSLVIQVDDTAKPDSTIVASQLSQAGTTVPYLIGNNASTMVTPMLRLVAGCLHPDTLISLAGGKGTKAVSSFTGEGELVVSAGGVETHVVGTVNGKEATLYAIRSKNGLGIKASAQHPFVTASGAWKAAMDLRPGDRVLTAQGVTEIASVVQTRHDGPVHNLILAHTAEALHPETESFFANGFLVGGHDAQQKLAAAKKADPARIEALLPEAFKVDYASHLADGGKQ